ncbi:MAG: glycoside hydrolase family 3 C-terminal domain-containing protein [Oscillospiraceae bacterium]|nr:glycoside hydrolase family 3 C-terminal domain-containing protein [Oscillospiraceae bacterium]MDD6146977.1 glycoside hydrolase family 3 C-terminal domain-containing protein [Oscillospiraceae bacterium]
MKNKEILEKLTLEEKVGLCSGKDFWHMKGVERLGIPEIMLTDGPHGLRKKNPEGKNGGLSDSVPSTCFPTAATTACSWDPDLLEEMGEALGEECLQEKVSVILGPGVNMKRSPLCGRNFEYFSEDPLLAGEMAAGLIKGVQSKNVGTSVKHFAVNSQEAKRMTIDSVVDERTLREIYLTAFEIAVKKGQPWTVMNAYNKVNGTYCSENAHLQKEILRDEWGFKGIVVTDWGAANDRVLGLKNGNELEMPCSGGYNDEKLCKAVRDGSLDESVLDESVDSLLSLIKKSEDALTENYQYDIEAHNALAAKICAQSVVLLKNEDQILPIDTTKKIAVIGEMARAPRYQGAGSSIINPHKLTDAFEGLAACGVKASFAPGYDKKKDVVSEVMIADACTVAKQADIALVFIGLTEEYESEGYDRSHLNLPVSHNKLVEEIAKVNPNTVVVLSGGSPVVMPWLGSVKAVLNGYLGGQAGGTALAQIICGQVNPCGKLAETYPLSLSDVPCSDIYPGRGLTAEHREGLYIGYRYYDSAKKEVLFPFGYGLSYTEFEYSDIKLSSDSILDSDTLVLSYKIKNIGSTDGAEISQVYVSDRQSTVYRPAKELRAFKKVFLKAGEEKTVEIELSKRAFAYYNVNINDWHVESGEFDILVGASSRDIRLSATVTVESTAKDAVVPDYRQSAPCYYTAEVKAVPDSAFEAVLGHAIPDSELDPSQKLTIANSLGDAKHTKWGGRINGLIDKIMNMAFKPDDPNGGMMKAMALEIPIRNFITMSSGVFSEKMANGLLMILNGDHPGKGLGKILGGIGGALKKLPALLKSI